MKNERLKVLLYNAIVWIKDECADFFASEVENEYDWFYNTLGITKKELNELDITLSTGEV